MTSSSDLMQQWQQDFGKLSTERKALEAQREPLETRLTDFNNEKPNGLWGKLKHAFAKATKMSGVNRRLRKLDTAIAGKDHALRGNALDVYTQLGENALRQMPNGDGARADYAVLGESLKLLNQTRDTVNNAIEQAEDASGMELMDAVSNNKGISLMSYFETSEAADAIKAAQRSIDALSKKLETAPKLNAEFGGDLHFDNNLGLALDMLGGFGGTFMSLSNKRDLDDAAENLRDISTRLDGVEEELQKGRRQLLGVAISAGRKGDPTMDLMADRLAFYLPEDAQKGMRIATPKRFTL